MKRCPHCDSILVCWNWIYAIADTRKAYHECWDCENVIETNNNVRNGIPYWVLHRFYPLWRRLIKGKKTIKGW